MLRGSAVSAGAETSASIESTLARSGAASLDRDSNPDGLDAFADIMRRLRASGLDEAIVNRSRDGNLRSGSYLGE